MEERKGSKAAREKTNAQHKFLILQIGVVNQN